MIIFFYLLIYTKITKINNLELLEFVLKDIDFESNIFISAYPLIVDSDNIFLKYQNLKITKRLLKKQLNSKYYKRNEKEITKLLQPELKKNNNIYCFFKKLKNKKHCKLYSFYHKKIDYELDILDKLCIDARKEYKVFGNYLLIHSKQTIKYLDLFDKKKLIIISCDLNYLKIIEVEHPNIKLIYYELEQDLIDEEKIESFVKNIQENL